MLLSSQSFAQADLFGTKATPVRNGFILNVNGSFNVPAGDMADRFGLAYRVGPAVLYKTKTNWMFGVRFDFLFAGKVKEDSLLDNVRDDEGYFINSSGRREAIEVAGRGYLTGLQLGRLIPLRKGATQHNLLAWAGGGFMQHKILINDKQGTIPQIKGDYRKGYDRLSNGAYADAYLGYAYFSSAGYANFHLGLEVVAGFTTGRRDYLYDVMRPGTGSRTDLLFGLRGGWFFPIFKRPSEETFYE